MAFVSRMVSDLTGKEAAEKDFVQVTVRQHPAVSEPKALDALPEEVAALRSLDEFVVLEFKDGGGVTQLVLGLADFREVVPDEVVVRARGTRGRRPGFRPGAP